MPLLYFIANQLEMMVTWTTLLKPNNSFVEFGLSQEPLTTKITANTSRFRTCGPGKRVIYIHKAKLTGLNSSTSYGKLG